MGKLIYSMITSLDGYVSGPDGGFDFGGADEELHDFVSERMASVGTYLYGRRLYELMVYWETAHLEPDQPQSMQDFARTWQGADKVVYSTTLNEVSSARTRIERTFEADAVRKLKAESDLDLTIDGPTLAAEAIGPGWSTSISSTWPRWFSAVDCGSSPMTVPLGSSCWTSI